MLTKIQLSAADCQVIETAISASPCKMLTVLEFIPASGFNINRLMVDRFFQTLRRKLNVYVDADLISYLGYEAEKEWDRKAKLMLLLKRSQKLVDGVDYFTLNNEQYAEFYAKTAAEIAGTENEINKEAESKYDEDSKGDEISPVHMDGRNMDGRNMEVLGFPHPSEFIGVHGRNQTSHLILTTHCFKKVMMKVNTSKADEIAEFYIAIEDLIVVYSGYQIEFGRREHANLSKAHLELKVDMKKVLDRLDEQKEENATLLAEVKTTNRKLDTANRKLDVQGENVIGLVGHLGAVSGRHVPRARIPSRQSESLWIVYAPGSKMPYRAYRAQESVCEQNYATLQAENSQARQVKIFRNNPNPREEFIYFRKRAGKNILCRRNKFCLTEGFTEADLIQLLDVVHAEKMEKYEKEVVRLQEEFSNSDDDDIDDHDSFFDSPNADDEPAASDSKSEEGPVEIVDVKLDEEPATGPVVYTEEVLLEKNMPQLKDIARATGGKRWSKLSKFPLARWIIAQYNR